MEELVSTASMITLATVLTATLERTAVLVRAKPQLIIPVYYTDLRSLKAEISFICQTSLDYHCFEGLAFQIHQDENILIYCQLFIENMCLKVSNTAIAVQVLLTKDDKWSKAL